DDERARERIIGHEEEEQQRQEARVSDDRGAEAEPRRSPAHECSSIQRRIPGSSAARVARAPTQPGPLLAPPNRSGAPRPFAATPVCGERPPAPPLAWHGRGGGEGGPAWPGAPLWAAWTRAAGRPPPSTTTLGLIAEAPPFPPGAPPAATGFERPMVTMAIAL